MMNLCTYFDSNYIDKGIVLYESLKNCGDPFKLFVIAFDEKCYDILYTRGYKPESIEIISFEEIENYRPILKTIKPFREKGEYYWTCTPIIIHYVLDKYNLDMCTYIDADMYFFSSPREILEELKNEKYSVGVMGHRFANPDMIEKGIERSGKYCVEFNTFKNDENAKCLLDLWEKQCIESCTYETCGDQRYISDWDEKYDFVHEYAHIGGGIAPWNLGDYKFDWINNRVICKKRSANLIFYHYQGMQYSDDYRVKLGAFTCNMGMVSRVKTRDIYRIYVPYLIKTENEKNKIREKYNDIEFKFGCKRKFDTIEFRLDLFIKGVMRRYRTESVNSALNFIVNVCRKKNDVLYLKKLDSYLR